jgi:hypothetical protein
MTYRKKRIRTAILALATAAILVPAAQAHTDFGSNGNGGDSASSADPYAYLPQEDRQAIALGLQASTTSASTSSIAQASAKTASQAIRPDDRGGARSVGQTTVASDYVGRQVANIEAKSSPVVHVDDRAGVRGPGPVETPPVVTTHDGFNWTDAGIGASAMLFVAALIAAALLARRRPSIAV